MSRAINVNATAAAISEICGNLGVTISVIEPLLSGGTRVVCDTNAGAQALRKQLGSKILQGSVSRSPFFLPHRY